MTEPIQPYRTFDEACQDVLAALRQRLGFSLWLVTRTEGEDWIVLAAEDHGYGVSRGEVSRWSDSFCYRMVQGLGPQVAPRVAEIEVYARAPIASQRVINAYMGVPICRSDGTLFGTLCATDPQPQSEEIEKDLGILHIMSRILATMLESDLRAQEDARMLERSRAEAMVDELTGLYNRRGWNQLLEAEESRCSRYGHPAGVVVLDLDGLKRVNDQEGHAAGDELLRIAAQAVREAVRQDDIVARLGGDEFGVLAIEMSGDGMEELVARIEWALEERGISASVGWAPRDPRVETGILAAVDEADLRMYRVKKGRRSSPAGQTRQSPEPAPS